jgi:hypothetical protein
MNTKQQEILIILYKHYEQVETQLAKNKKKIIISEIKSQKYDLFGRRPLLWSEPFKQREQQFPYNST